MRERPAFRIGTFEGHAEVVIPARWPGAAGLFGLVLAVPVWIAAASLKWGLGLAAGGKTGLLLVGGVATAIFVTWALLQLVWWLGGAERIAVIHGDLLVRHTIFRVPVTTRSYQGRGIRFLATSDMPPAGWLAEPALPFASSSRCGSVKFFHQESTVYLGHDLAPAAARQVVDWLAQRLPPGTSDRVT